MSGGGPRVLLMGMMGAGKTTVGTALSHRTGWPYYDNDQLVELATGRRTPDVLEEDGEPGLRQAERAALGTALTVDAPVIAAVAGGVVDDDRDRERLRAGGYVVWLRARIETLARRVGSGHGRPWLQPDPETALRALYAGREGRYAEAASLVVDVDTAGPEEVADRILAGLRDAGLVTADAR